MVLRQRLLAEGSVRAAQGWTLSEAVDYTARHVWENTRGYRTAMINSRAAVDFFGGNTPLSQIDRAQLDRYVDHLRERGNAPGTINRKLAALSKVLGTANEAGGLATMPKLPKRRREAEGRIRFLSHEEEEKIIATLYARGTPQYAECVIVLMDTGLRCGELFRLTRRDVSAKSATVWETKGNLPRTLPLTNRASAILKSWCEGKKPHETIAPCDYRELRYAWDAVRQALGYEDDPQFVLHMLRHTFASRLAQRGAGILLLQTLLGHRVIAMTRRYAHLQPAQLEEAIKLLEVPIPQHTAHLRCTPH